MQLGSSAPAATRPPTTSRRTDGMAELERRRRAARCPAPTELGVRAGARGARHRPPRAALRALHRRRVRRAALAASTSTTINPATEETLAEVAAGRRGGRRRGGRGRARGVRRRSGRSCGPPSARKYLYRIARVTPGAGARVRGRRDDGRRQADQGVARRRRAARGRALLLLRGLGRQARVRVPRPQRRARSASPGRSSRGTSRC